MGGGRFAARLAPFRTSKRSDCDLIAAILNPNRSFSATLAHESEITSEFVLVFNRFAGTIVRKGTLCGMEAEQRGAGATRAGWGPWQEQFETAEAAAGRQACWPTSPNSYRLWHEACSIRTALSFIICAGRAQNGTPNTMRCRRSCACGRSANAAQSANSRYTHAFCRDAGSIAGPREGSQMRCRFTSSLSRAGASTVS